MASITLDSNLIFNIYIPADDRITKVMLNGVEEALGEAIDGYYLITVELPANEAAKTLTLVATLNIDGTLVDGTFTFSTVKYAEKILAMNSVSAEEKTLAKDMLAYIKSAYIYFNEAELTDEDIVAIDAVLNGYVAEFSKVEGIVNTASGLYGVTFILDSTPKVRFILPEGASADAYTFKIGNTVLDYTVGTTVDEGKNLTHVDISLYAYKMISTITYKCGTVSGSYHINSYYDGVDKNDTNLVALVECFYNYCKSAKAYRDYVIANQ